MEIYSLRSAHSLFYKNNSKNNQPPETAQQKPFARPAHSFDLSEELDINFSSISPRGLRSVALENLNAGRIDDSAYRTLAQALPDHTVDLYGNVIDLKSVTDDTDFDFKSYYETRLRVAEAFGDGAALQDLEPVVEFLNSRA